MWWLLSFVVAWAMSHLRAFCHESHFVANTRFLGLFCADFYADIWDLTQILRRYLDKKSAAESSALDSINNSCNVLQRSPLWSISMADKKLGFFESFMLSGAAAGVSKTAAAPIERVKLLVQNQDEMIKQVQRVLFICFNLKYIFLKMQGRLDKPYKGVIDCTKRVFMTEGIYPFWRGELHVIGHVDDVENPSQLKIWLQEWI